jgi:aconitate hydratase
VGHSGHGLSAEGLDQSVPVQGKNYELRNGHVVIAAITSCTNTSNPGVMLSAGLLARNARRRGLNTMPWVKTSLAPGSRVVTEYYRKAGLLEDLAALGFNVVGYGCTTCIGNSGPLDPDLESAIRQGNLIVGGVLSGNRNFEGRIHNWVKANYLASPPLVVAYAIAGTLDIDLENDPIGQDVDGNDVYLRDVWPSDDEIRQTMASCIDPSMFEERYSDATREPRWDAIDVAEQNLYPWSDSSTYIRLPSFFDGIRPTPSPITTIQGARVLLKLGDSVTTDHISPAGAIPADGPAGRYLEAHGVDRRDFNSFGSRRGNHEVMMRGTFANVRIRNQVAPGTEGGYTTHFPTGEVESIYDAAVKYQQASTPLVVLAGTQYGTGSSRDWAAKGTLLLGVRAVISKSFERIHRSNLVGMGVLPLCFRDGDGAEELGLDGTETFDIAVQDDVKPLQDLEVSATRADGTEIRFTTTVRLDTPVEVDYYRNGGILQTVVRNLAQS